MVEKIICPKIVAANESTESNLSSIFDVAAGNRSNFPEMFEKTHTPIILIDSNGNETKEEDLFSHFIKNYQGNSCTVIEGETGTGKSEVCVKISYWLQAHDWELIHIHKNMDLPKMISNLLDFYETFSGKQLPKSSNFMEMSKTLNDRNKRHAKTKIIVGKFFDEDVLFDSTHKIQRDIQTIANEFEILFKSKIGNIVRSQQLTDYEAEFFSSTDLKNTTIKTIISLLKEPLSASSNRDMEEIEILEHINKKLWEHLNTIFDSPKMDDIMDAISIEAEKQNKRVAMIIEDLKIATLDLQKLLLYIERDKPEDKWDFLIAGTSDVIRNVKNIPTREERFNFYRTNDAEAVNVRFLNKENAISFAGKYMTFLHETYGSQCSSCNKCSEEIREFFPYNDAFLQTIFDKLDEQKPRTYIRKLYQGIRHYLKKAEPPTNSSEIISMRKEILDFSEPFYEENIVRFIAFYNKLIEEEGSQYYSVSKDFFERFYIDYASIPSQKLKVNEILIPKQISGRRIDTRTSTSQFPPPPTSIPSSDPIEILTEKNMHLLERSSSWATATSHQLETVYAKINLLFKLGVREMLRIFTNNFTLTSDSLTSYRYGKSEFPIYHMNEKIGQSNLLQSPVEPTSIPDGLIRNIIILGCAIDDNVKLIDEEKIALCEDGIPIFMNLAAFWRQDFNEHIYGSMSGLFVKKNSNELVVEKVLSEFTSFVLKLAFPHIELKPSFVFYLLNESKGLEEFRRQLQNSCSHYGITNKQEIDSISSNALKLFKMYSQFKLGNSNVHFHDDFLSIIDNEDMDEIISKVKKNKIESLDKKIIFDGIQLSELISPIKVAHKGIKDQLKLEKLECHEFESIIENLTEEEREKTLKIIKKNSTIIRSLDSVSRNKIKNIENLFEDPTYDDIVYNLDLMRSEMFFQQSKNQHSEEEFISFSNFKLNNYLFWKWFLNQEIYSDIKYLLTKSTKVDTDDSERIFSNIEKIKEEIRNVYL